MDILKFVVSDPSMNHRTNISKHFSGTLEIPPYCTTWLVLHTQAMNGNIVSLTDLFMKMMTHMTLSPDNAASLSRVHVFDFTLIGKRIVIWHLSLQM